MPIPIKIIIHGLGKMGRAVHRLAAADADVAVVATVDGAAADADARALDASLLARADAVVDFTGADAVLPLVRQVAAAGGAARVVTGTSAWQDDDARVRRVVEDAGLYFLHGANFALGTALFLRLAAVAAGLLARAGGFDVGIRDIHHRHKADMPSGTARQLAATVLANFPGKTEPLYGAAAGPVRPDQLHVSCLRLGENMGFHEVIFDAPAEVVTISQQTRDRGAYAAGALRAAKWLMTREQPGFYTFNDVVEETIYGKG